MLKLVVTEKKVLSIFSFFFTGGNEGDSTRESEESERVREKMAVSFILYRGSKLTLITRRSRALKKANQSNGFYGAICGLSPEKKRLTSFLSIHFPFPSEVTKIDDVIEGGKNLLRK